MFKNLGSGLKGLIFTEEPDTAAPVAAPVAQPQVHSMTPSVELAPVDSVLDTASIQASIIAAIEQTPGFDRYTRFQAAATSLEKVILVEGTRLQAAQATSGFTRDQLLESISAHQSVLASETQNFQDNYVVQAEQAIAVLHTNAEALNAEIQQLTARLAEVSTQKEAVIADALTKSSELAKAKIDFSSVVQTITNKYAEVSTKLQQYLSA